MTSEELKAYNLGLLKLIQRYSDHDDLHNLSGLMHKHANDMAYRRYSGLYDAVHCYRERHSKD